MHHYKSFERLLVARAVVALDDQAAALARAIVSVRSSVAEFENHSSIEEVLTDAPTPATWSDNCECVPAAPTKILPLQTAAASPEYGCPRVCTVQTGRVSPPPSPARAASRGWRAAGCR